MRNIILEGRIVADAIEEAYDLRKKLLNIFNPKYKGRLIFKDLSIPCLVEEAPVLWQKRILRYPLSKDFQSNRTSPPIF